jgi:hypothetical protein
MVFLSFCLLSILFHYLLIGLVAQDFLQYFLCMTPAGTLKTVLIMPLSLKTCISPCYMVLEGKGAYNIYFSTKKTQEYSYACSRYF